MEKRRKFSQEFKQEAVRLVSGVGVVISQVAKDLGINEWDLGRWCREQESEWAASLSWPRGGAR